MQNYFKETEDNHKEMQNNQRQNNHRDAKLIQRLKTKRFRTATLTKNPQGDTKLPQREAEQSETQQPQRHKTTTITNTKILQRDAEQPTTR